MCSAHRRRKIERNSAFRQVLRWKELYDVLDSYVRKGFFALDENERQDGKDIMWYIWLHPDSPLFGKDKMATFERYFLQDAETHIEKRIRITPCLKMKSYQSDIGRVWVRPGGVSYCQRTCSGETKRRGKSREMRRESACDRRRIFQSVSERNRNCRLYFDL